MKFVAYLTYNNNGDALFGLNHDGHWVEPGFRTQYGIGFDTTPDGLVLFRHRFADFNEKIAYYTHLQAGLKKAFGHGFAVAAAAQSDCSSDREMAQFCIEMKKLDPAITTLLYAAPHCAMPDTTREAHYASEGHEIVDAYRDIPVLSAREAFAANSKTPLRQDIDYFFNYLGRGAAQQAFVQTMRQAAAGAAASEVPDAFREKLGAVVARAYAASENKLSEFKAPRRYMR